MPRVSRHQADLNREAITETASRLFRERGLRGLSVGELMGAVGLTHGGFYGHFESKEALAAEACERAFTQALNEWQAVVATQGGHIAFKAVVDYYLSSQSRDQRGASCPVVAFSADMALENGQSAIRKTYISGLEALIEMFTEILPRSVNHPFADRRREAIAQYSMLVGALTLAKATGGSALSDEVLASVLEHFQGTQDAREQE